MRLYILKIRGLKDSKQKRILLLSDNNTSNRGEVSESIYRLFLQSFWISFQNYILFLREAMIDVSYIKI